MPQLRNEDAVSTLSVKPGVKLDGTIFDGDFWSVGQHTRFRNGRPKKMGGYREIANGFPGPASSVFVFSQFPQHQISTYHPDGITCDLVDNNGVGSSLFDRTPAGFVSDTDYVWQVTSMFDSTGTGQSVVIAHPGQNGSYYDQTTDTPVYYGDAVGAGPFLAVGESVSGGCTVLERFLVIYGNDGLIKNSDANDPTNFATGFADENNPVADKIIKGLPLRGGSRAPAGLFWSISALIRMVFLSPASPGAPIWQFDIVSDAVSILAPNSPVEYDGIYYWPGVDRFLAYNGVVKELPNPMNQDFFFDNLNWAARSRVWGTKVPRWGEIWWFFPKGTSEVCNHAVIYNVREGTWYDTPLERSAGFAPRALRWPVWADSTPNADSTPTGLYRLWQHEYGVDRIQGVDQVAIDSFVETSALGIIGDGTVQDGQTADNFQTIVTRIEPDLVQQQNMEIIVTGGAYARSVDVPSAPYAMGPDQPRVDVREQRRLPRVRFRSNEQGGDFFMGRVLIHLERGDKRE